MECYIQCHPWDLVDEDIDLVFDRLQGQCGATGIDLIGACDETELFRPHASAVPRIYRTTGGVFHRPDEERYGGSRLRPPTWSEHRSLDVVALASERCATRRLDLRVSIDPFCSHRLVHRTASAACKNLWHIPSRRALCPSNPDVHAYLQALIAELAIYDDVSAVVLTSAQRPSATDPHAIAQARTLCGDSVARLLAICFCESCLQGASAAQIDGGLARQAAAQAIDQRARAGSSREHLQDAHLTRYLAWQHDTLRTCVTLLGAATSKELLAHDGPAARGESALWPGAPHLVPDRGRETEANSFGERRAGARGPTPGPNDSCHGLLDGTTLDDCVDRLILGSAALSESGRRDLDFELCLRCVDGDLCDAPAVVRTVTAAVQSGATAVTVVHYGAILEAQFDGLRQALRHARRSSL